MGKRIPLDVVFRPKARISVGLEQQPSNLPVAGSSPAAPAKPDVLPQPVIEPEAPKPVNLPALVRKLTKTLTADELQEVFKWQRFYERARVQNRKNQKAWYDRQKAAK